MWVLVVGIGSGAFAGGSGTQYFLGTFDGERFESLGIPSEALWLDYGSDCYATQSWSGSPSDQPTVISWMSNWAYAGVTPTAEFRGLMTLPRQLSLIPTGSGPRLFQRLPESVAARFPRTPAKFGQRETEASFDLSTSGVHRCCLELALGLGETVDLCLFGETNPWLTLTRAGDRVVKVGQCRSGTLFDGQKLPGFATDCSFELEAGDLVKVDVLLDGGAVEVSIEGGRAWISSLFFPADPAGPLRVHRRMLA
jgi:fructan beta-fructosidase